MFRNVCLTLPCKTGQNFASDTIREKVMVNVSVVVLCRGSSDLKPRASVT